MPQEIAKLFDDLEQAGLKRQSEEAKSDPLAHKMTRTFEAPTSYRYAANLTNGRGQTVRFCWSCHRNVAGFFMGWRETIRKDGFVKRDMWVSRRVKLRVKEIAVARSRAMRERVDDPAAIDREAAQKLNERRQA